MVTKKRKTPAATLSAHKAGSESAPLGLRERNKLDKRERILATASRLFAEKGYSSVTTSSIAKQAHVGNGTLFRYARTKADLLVAVMNELMLNGIRNGLAAAHETGDPVGSILTVLQPLSDEGLNFPENIIAYEKEALFGDKTHQDLVTTRIADVEQAILRILEITKTQPREADISQADLARAIYATIYMDLIKASVGHDAVATLPERIPITIRNLIRAFCER